MKLFTILALFLCHIAMYARAMQDEAMYLDEDVAADYMDNYRRQSNLPNNNQCFETEVLDSGRVKNPIAESILEQEGFESDNSNDMLVDSQSQALEAQQKINEIYKSLSQEMQENQEISVGEEISLARYLTKEMKETFEDKMSSREIFGPITGEKLDAMRILLNLDQKRKI